MLVLGIKTDDVIVINENIKINFRRVNENKVRIAIDAPSDVSVLRSDTESKE